MSISAVINTRNASGHLEKVIDHLKDFDEILVCDMESTDGSPELAERLGARVVSFPIGPDSSIETARSFAIQCAKSKWVLLVEADELVPPQLVDYLYDFIHSDNPANGLYIPRKNFVMDKFNRLAYPDYQLRLFVKELSMWPAHVGHQPSVEGRVDRIPSRRRDLALVHIPRDLASDIDIINRSTTTETESDPNHTVSLPALWLLPKMSFLYSFILKGGWRHGSAGYIIAKNKALLKYLTLAKVYEHNAMREFHDKNRALRHRRRQ